MADKTLASLGPQRRWRQFSGEVQPFESQLNPPMNSAVTVLGRKCVPFMVGWENQAVGPIRVVRDNAASCRTPDQRAQRRQLFHLNVFLKIAE